MGKSYSCGMDHCRQLVKSTLRDEGLNSVLATVG